MEKLSGMLLVFKTKGRALESLPFVIILKVSSCALNSLTRTSEGPHCASFLPVCSESILNPSQPCVGFLRDLFSKLSCSLTSRRFGHWEIEVGEWKAGGVEKLDDFSFGGHQRQQQLF